MTFPSDQPLTPEHPGELYFRGPQIHIGYLNNPVATAKSLSPADPSDPDQRPWFKTGDFGYMCGPTKRDGFAFLNRLGDSLRLRGFLTNPGEWTTDYIGSRS
jgi:acyl-CoA synthetase (AMP-forming)/AMP-acid ligase II